MTRRNRPSTTATLGAGSAGLLAAGLLALVVAGPAAAVEGPIQFGAPTVLSEQGQRLKVVVPVQSPPNDRATAASFLVTETEVPQGFAPLPAQSFTVMRPQQSDYVVFQSGEVVRTPEVALVVSVAGDPNSPYRMDLRVPAAGTSRLAAAGAAVQSPGGRMTVSDVPTRRLRGPVGASDLPPK
ncbi:MAG: hypothetical protein AB7G13_34040 [Lautropia sp.]